jgi:vitamin B12 transporter
LWAQTDQNPPVSPVASSEAAPSLETSSTTLETVVVTASRAEEQLKSVSRAITVITEDEIKLRNTQDLLGLLKHYGIQINEYNGGGGATLTMRGFHTPDGILSQSNVLVLVDGRRAGLEYVSMVPLQNIERVEIIKGAASMQYGAEALGGVVNLITKRGGEKPSFAVEQSFGSWDAMKTQAAFSGQANKFDLSVGGSFYRSDDYKLPNGTTFPNTGTPQKYSGSVNVGYNFNEYNRLGLMFTGYDGIHGYSNQINPATGKVNNPNGRNYRKNHSLDLLYEGGLPEYNLSWQTRYFQGQTTQDSDSDWPNRWRTTGAYGHWYHYVNDFQGAQAQIQWNNGLLHLTTGFDYYTADYIKRVWHIASPPNNAGKTDVSGYLIGKLAFLDDTLWLNGGLRYGQYGVEVKDEGGVNIKKTKLTPSFGVTYLPVEWLKLRANYAESFKMPEPQNIAYDFYSSSTGDHYIPNFNLQPESAKTWEVGADVAWNGLTFGLTYFATNHTDEAAAREVGSTTPKTMQFQNIRGTTKYRGLESSLDWSMGETFQWNFDIRPYFSLTRLLKYELPEVDPRTGYNKAYFRADLMMSYGLSFSHPGWGLTSSLDFTYAGERIAPASWATYEPGEIPNNKWGKFTTVDFHVAQDVYKRENGGRLTLKLDVLNLTNADYFQQVLYRQPGRSYVGSIRYEF